MNNSSTTGKKAGVHFLHFTWDVHPGTKPEAHPSLAKTNGQSGKVASATTNVCRSPANTFVSCGAGGGTWKTDFAAQLCYLPPAPARRTACTPSLCASIHPASSTPMPRAPKTESRRCASKISRSGQVAAARGATEHHGICHCSPWRQIAAATPLRRPNCPSCSLLPLTADLGASGRPTTQPDANVHESPARWHLDLRSCLLAACCPDILKQIAILLS